MKIEKKGANPVASFGGPITKQNFTIRAAAFGNARGFAVLHRWSKDGFQAQEAQWNAWMCWLASRQINYEFMATFGAMTVPSEWPEEFDSNWPPSDREFRYPGEPFVSPEERARVSRKFDRLLDSLESTERSKRAGVRADARRIADADLRAGAVEYWHGELAANADRYAATPLTLSSDARAFAKLDVDALADLRATQAAETAAARPRAPQGREEAVEQDEGF